MELQKLLSFDRLIDHAPSFEYNDGGRKATGFRGRTGDCVTRAIAIATGKPYHEVYDAINEAAQSERVGVTKLRRKTSDERPIVRIHKRSSARTGVRKDTSRKFLADLGWIWHPTMTIGSGCKIHLRADELPRGRLIVAVSKHYVAVIDGVIHDLSDCSRGGTRCVYGYYTAPGVK